MWKGKKDVFHGIYKSRDNNRLVIFWKGELSIQGTELSGKYLMIQPPAEQQVAYKYSLKFRNGQLKKVDGWAGQDLRIPYTVSDGEIVSVKWKNQDYFRLRNEKPRDEMTVNRDYDDYDYDS